MNETRQKFGDVATKLDGGGSRLSLCRESIAVRHEVVRLPQRRTSVV